MSEAPESALSHVSVGTNDLDRAVAFYDRILAPLGIRRMETTPDFAGWGRRFPEFFVHKPHDGQPASVGNGAHVGFLATDRAAVEGFHRAALEAGGRCEGPPGTRPQYSEHHYAAFIRDPDGNKLEAMFWEGPLPA